MQRTAQVRVHERCPFSSDIRNIQRVVVPDSFRERGRRFFDGTTKPLKCRIERESGRSEPPQFGTNPHQVLPPQQTCGCTGSNRELVLQEREQFGNHSPQHKTLAGNKPEPSHNTSRVGSTNCALDLLGSHTSRVRHLTEMLARGVAALIDCRPSHRFL